MVAFPTIVNPDELFLSFFLGALSAALCPAVCLMNTYTFAVCLSCYNLYITSAPFTCVLGGCGKFSFARLVFFLFFNFYSSHHRIKKKFAHRKTFPVL